MLSFASYIIPFALNFLATCMIYTGILFISTQLTPSILEVIYANTNTLSRTVIATLLAIAPANIIIGYVYKNYAASTAGITNIVAVVLVLTIIAVVIDNIKVNATIVVSLLLAIFACSFLLFNLTK